jgi:hypothetical protein
MADEETTEETEPKVTLQHPDLEDVTVEVPTDDVSAWLAQGWLEDAPKKTAAKKTAKKSASSSG